MQLLKMSAICAGLCLATAALAAEPSKLLSVTSLPEISGGDFAHLDLELARNRLYVPSEVYGSIEVFNLPDGRHVSSKRGLAVSPHKILLAKQGKELWIADAGGASLNIVDTATLSPGRSIALAPQPDSGIVDEKRGIFYVGNGGKDGQELAYISLISLADGSVTGRIEVPAKQVKGMAIDAATDRLFANFRDRHEVGVIDLATQKLVGLWQIPRPSRNPALAFEAQADRQFVGARNPGKLLVLDAANGKLAQTLDIVETSDEIIVDSQHRRIYIASARLSPRMARRISGAEPINGA